MCRLGFEHHSEDQEFGVDDQARPYEVSVVRVAGGAPASLDLEKDVEVWVKAIDLVGDACGAILAEQDWTTDLPEAVLAASIS